jgi:aspartate/methionine/tyrosine aminotransferase
LAAAATRRSVHRFCYDFRMSTTATALPVADRVHGFTYAIRNIVAEATKVEATGTKVRYLNIGDPIPFGFKTPVHLIEAVAKAMRDGANAYTPSVGIASAREAVAADWTARGMPATADRVLLTAGTSEGIELTLGAVVNAGDDVLVPTPTYPLYTAVLAKLGAKESYYRTDPSNGWLPDIDHLKSMIGPRTKALVTIDPNNPTGAVYPTAIRKALLDIAETHGLLVLADEVYGDLTYDGSAPPLAVLNPDGPIISYSSLSKAWLAPGWRAGWLVVGRSPRLNDVLAGIKKLADGRLCSTGPMQYAIEAAMTGDRSHQETLRVALRERADLTVARLNAIDGMSCVAPTSAFYAMPKVDLPPGTTDRDYVLGLLRATGVLCVYGSGFGLPAEDGFMRVVFLASPAELSDIYDLVAEYTRTFLDA